RRRIEPGWHPRHAVDQRLLRRQRGPRTVGRSPCGGDRAVRLGRHHSRIRNVQDGHPHRADPSLRGPERTVRHALRRDRAHGPVDDAAGEPARTLRSSARERARRAGTIRPAYGGLRCPHAARRQSPSPGTAPSSRGPLGDAPSASWRDPGPPAKPATRTGQTTTSCLKRASSMADAPKVVFESRMLIDGKLVDGQAGRFVNINPATEDVLGEVADASKADMHRAIDAARRAFDETDWSTNRAFRKHCLEQLQEALEGEKEALREELILEAGCPRMVTHGPQLDAPLRSALSYPAKLIDEYPWETDLGDAVVELTGQLTTRKILREPVGVVGAIVPWNFPFEVTINKIGQALATGNTVVLKPAPDTPFNATRLGRLIAECTDVPPGVVNVVTASDHLVGEELTLSPKVDLISFTGSTAVGKRIMEKGAATMKRLFLELGGKSATIVLEDADLQLSCMIGIAPCMHAGQGCAIPTRLLLPRSRYDEGVQILEAMYQSVAVG